MRRLRVTCIVACRLFAASLNGIIWFMLRKLFNRTERAEPIKNDVPVVLSAFDIMTLQGSPFAAA